MKAVRSARRAKACKAICGLAFVVVATGLLLVRQGGSPSWKTVWSEDVNVFYLDAVAHPFHETVLMPYAGYAHFLPRLLAAIGVELKVWWYAPWVAFTSALVAALLALFVYYASEPLLRAPLRRGILACATVLLPILPFEVIGAICNVQWFFALPCLLAVLFPVYRVGPVVVRAVIAVIGPITAPLAALLAPVAAWQLVAGLRRRAPTRTLVVPMLYLLSSSVQVLVYLTATRIPAESTSSALVPDLVKIYSARVVNDLVFGVRVTERLWPTLGWGLVVISSAIMALLLAVKLMRAGRRARWWIAGLIGASVVLFVVQLLPRQNHIVGTLPDAVYLLGGVRWMVLPALLLVMALLVPPEVPDGVGVRPMDEPTPSGTTRAAQSTSASGGGWWQQVTAGLPWVGVVVVAALWLAISVVPSFRLDNDRSDHPTWPDVVGPALEACDIDPTQVPVLAIPPGWHASVPCEDLT